MNKLKFKDSRYSLQVGLNEIGTKNPDQTSILVSIIIQDKNIAKYMFGTMLRQQLIEHGVLSRNIHPSTKLLKYKAVGNILVMVIQPQPINQLTLQRTFKVFKAVVQSAFDLLEVNKRLAKT